MESMEMWLCSGREGVGMVGLWDEVVLFELVY